MKCFEVLEGWQPMTHLAFERIWFAVMHAGTSFVCRRPMSSRLTVVKLLFTGVVEFTWLAAMLHAFWFADALKLSQVPKSFRLRHSRWPWRSSFHASRSWKLNSRHIFSIMSAVGISLIRLRSNMWERTFSANLLNLNDFSLKLQSADGLKKGCSHEVVTPIGLL